MTPFGTVQSSVTNGSISPNTSQQSSNVASADNLGNEQTFLQLLVAQLQYQDPLQPADGTQFVTQLAQFSDLEQQIGSHQDLDAIKQVLTASSPAAIPTATDTGSQSGSSSTTPTTNGASMP